MQCTAKIRPLPSPIEIECELVADHLADVPTHRGVLRDYAYPGSTTVIEWQDSDRRTYRGRWSQCGFWSGVGRCPLPVDHHGNHA